MISGGYTDRQDFLFKEVYRIPPNDISKAGVISSIWDALNDPLLGSWMDKRRFNAQKLKTIMRISAITGNILAVARLFDGGMTPWQHLALLMFCNMSQDIIGTMDEVAGQKVRNAISPLTEQRGRTNVWGRMGMRLGWPLADFAMVFMAFRETFGFTDYQIIFYGACIIMPLKIASSLLLTFIRQRVDYSQPAAGAGEEEAPPRRSLLQSFQVVKHNRYFIASTIANFITVFSPDVGDELMIYRYLVPSFRVFGREMSGEGVLVAKRVLSGIPGTLTQPFVRQIIRRFGGPLRAQKCFCVILMVCNLAKYFAGYTSIGRLGLVILLDSIINAVQEWEEVAGALLNYEFFDYVELQTGERSEGVTTAVNNLFSKIVTRNIGQVTGNAFLQWTGYRGGYTQDGTRPPARYLAFMWPMLNLMPLIDWGVRLAARSFVKWTPADRARTEQALASRRAAAQTLQEEPVH